MPQAEPILLPGREHHDRGRQADLRRSLHPLQPKENGSVLNAARAALADDSGNYLAWFAQRLAIQQNADLVVMGHTHTPIGGLTVSPINYYNSGFECVAVPDNPPKEFTFTIVDLESASAELMQVQHGDYAISVAPVPALPSVVLPPAIDFSCYVRILNHGSEPLTLTGSSATNYWVVPPQTIPAGGRGDGWLQDDSGLHGSEGTFTYSQGGTPLQFSVSCPTGLSRNTASGAGQNFVARSGSGDWGLRGQVPTAGHPLQVLFTVGAPKAT